MIRLLLVLSLCFVGANDANADALKKDVNGAYISKEAKFKFEILQQQDDVVWGFDFLSSGRIIFTERSGALRVLDLRDKKLTDIKGAPKVWSRGQGGLLDVRVHPKKKDLIYLTYSEPVGDESTTAFASAVLKGDRLTQFKKIFSAEKATDENIHFGSRIEFDKNGFIYVSVGDRNTRREVQKLSSDIGKLHRFKEDGSVPEDNPFAKDKNAKASIWSLGHRSPQGLTLHPETGELYLIEMGPRGGDEVNLIKKGANYGWPDVTYGREYYGPRIGVTKKEGTEQPVVYWVPSISPSGSSFYSGKSFPNWKNNLFIGNLSGQHLRRLVIESGKVVAQEELLKDLNLRIRNVRPGPDGAIYLSTDDGKIVRLIEAH